MESFCRHQGFTTDAFEGIVEIDRSRLRVGGRNKIILLAKTYVRACAGIWSPPTVLPEGVI